MKILFIILVTLTSNPFFQTTLLMLSFPPLLFTPTPMQSKAVSPTCIFFLHQVVVAII